MEFGSNYQFSSHFGNSKKINRVLKNNCYFFTSGRIAIKFICENSGLKNIYIPNFLCEEVYNCFEGLEKEFYQLSDKFEYLKGLENIKDNSIVFISNYFGLSDETVFLKILEKEKQTEKNLVVIYDITHSLFAARNSDVVDFYVASVRKWLPIPDGAIVSCDKNFNIDFAKAPEEMVKDFIYASVLKLLYVNSNKKDDNLNKEYRKLFVDCEEKLAEIKGYCAISDYSKNYIENFNEELLISRRRENYNLLAKSLTNPNINLCSDKCLQGEVIPFSFPIRCKKRDELRKYLIQNQVYCAIHWNQDYMPQNVKKVDLSEQILSIPIDERYTKKEIKVLAEIINKFGE